MPDPPVVQDQQLAGLQLAGEDQVAAAGVGGDHGLATGQAGAAHQQDADVGHVVLVESLDGWVPDPAGAGGYPLRLHQDFVVAGEPGHGLEQAQRVGQRGDEPGGQRRVMPLDAAVHWVEFLALVQRLVGAGHRLGAVHPQPGQ